MHLTLRKLTLGLAFIGLGGCIATDHLLLTNTPLLPRPEGAAVEILVDPPARPFTKVAMVEAVAKSRLVTWNDLREALRNEASKVGADAIMDISVGGEPHSALVGSGAGGTFSIVGSSGMRKKLRGVAIRYK